MTGPDTETLRRALRSGMDQGGDQAPGLDVTLIMHRGSRLRLRRRLAALAGGVCAIAALTGAATAAAGLATAPPSHSQPVSPAHQGRATQGVPAPSRSPGDGPTATPVPRVPTAPPTATSSPSATPTKTSSVRAGVPTSRVAPSRGLPSPSPTTSPTAATGPTPDATPAYTTTRASFATPVASRS